MGRELPFERSGENGWKADALGQFSPIARLGPNPLAHGVFDRLQLAAVHHGVQEQGFHQLIDESREEVQFRALGGLLFAVYIHDVPRVAEGRS
jgi:hypothetical protein